MFELKVDPATRDIEIFSGGRQIATASVANAAQLTLFEALVAGGDPPQAAADASGAIYLPVIP